MSETEQQVELLDGLLEDYDESGSMVKDLTGRLMAFGQNVSGMIASDEVVKGGLFSIS